MEKINYKDVLNSQILINFINNIVYTNYPVLSDMKYRFNVTFDNTLNHIKPIMDIQQLSWQLDRANRQRDSIIQEQKLQIIELNKEISKLKRSIK